MPRKTKAKLGFIGAGTVGSALSRRLAKKGYAIVAIYSRSPTSAHKLADTIPAARVCASSQGVADLADIVFITTPDGVIPEVAAAINWRPDQMVVHCSGADSSAILEPARTSGAQVGVFHPLQTFASVGQAIANLPGSTFSIEAEEPLLGTLKRVAYDLGGQWVVLRAEDKVLYHAAAVMACNYVVTLMKLSTDLWATFGISQPEAVRALLPLLKGTVNNIEAVGLPNCLTGPIARGDLGTIKKHLVALEQKAPNILSTYRELGRQTIPISLAKGKIDQNQAHEMELLLN
ncbi:MAG: DUF2520 domain-containing protein [Chloroflexi bacterium]|nr:DUF2520 domain-containing protein [Chloroflexota bacterium]